MLYSDKQKERGTLAFFFFHVQGPERTPRIHCSLKAYCARPYIVF